MYTISRFMLILCISSCQNRCPSLNNLPFKIMVKIYLVIYNFLWTKMKYYFRLKISLSVSSFVCVIYFLATVLTIEFSASVLVIKTLSSSTDSRSFQIFFSHLFIRKCNAPGAYIQINLVRNMQQILEANEIPFKGLTIISGIFNERSCNISILLSKY